MELKRQESLESRSFFVPNFLAALCAFLKGVCNTICAGGASAKVVWRFCAVSPEPLKAIGKPGPRAEAFSSEPEKTLKKRGSAYEPQNIKLGKI